jgi:hypothetical protein
LSGNTPRQDGCATAVVTADGACFTWGAAHNALGRTAATSTAHEGHEVARQEELALPHPRAVDGPWHRNKHGTVSGVALGSYHALLFTRTRDV